MLFFPPIITLLSEFITRREKLLHIILSNIWMSYQSSAEINLNMSPMRWRTFRHASWKTFTVSFFQLPQKNLSCAHLWRFHNDSSDMSFVWHSGTQRHLNHPAVSEMHLKFKSKKFSVLTLQLCPLVHDWLKATANFLKGSSERTKPLQYSISPLWSLHSEDS